MTRKETIVTNAPIGQWLTKTNLMSDYIGDLDELDSGFREYDLDSAKHHDSSVVMAINYLWDTVDSINTLLSQGSLALKTLTADSATFRIIRTGMLIADSATIDSANIANLTVTGKLIAESAEFDRINVNQIDLLPGANLFIDSATINTLNATNIVIDSASITNLSASSIIADSGTFDSATINDLLIPSGGTFTFDGNVFTDTHLLTVKNEAGTIVLTGYFLTTNSDIGIA